MSGTPEGPVHPEPAETHAAESALTERHLARRAAELRDYRAAFRVSQLAMAVVDEDGVVVVANDSFGIRVQADRGCGCRVKRP